MNQKEKEQIENLIKQNFQYSSLVTDDKLYVYGNINKGYYIENCEINENGKIGKSFFPYSNTKENITKFVNPRRERFGYELIKLSEWYIKRAEYLKTQII